MTSAVPAEWLARHRAVLDAARAAIRTRVFYSAYPEVPSGKIYGETAAADGKAAFERRLGAAFDLGQPAAGAEVATERSPFGLALDVRYPVADVDAVFAAAAAAQPAWIDAGADLRAGVALEILARLNRASFEIGHATMHTTGQAFGMAFAAGGPNAQDRALEAIAYAYDEMTRVPASVRWEKPQGRGEPLVVDKTFRIVPRGIALTIGCSTFPNWNSYPGIFASLVTGNAVVIKPHPQAVLPLAITAEIGRATLREAGFDPNLIALVVDPPGRPQAQELALRPEVKIVDYTGSSAFGTWLEEHAHAQVYTEKAGINAAVIDSTGDFTGMTRNLALSLALYSGQMCTAPQNIFVPRAGIATEAGHRSFDEVAAGVVAAIDALLAAPERAVEILGAIVSDATLARIDAENAQTKVLRRSEPIVHPQFPQARVRTPLLAVLDARDAERYDREMFGPIAYVIATDSTVAALALATTAARRSGAITGLFYSTDAAAIARAEASAAQAGISLAVNLTGALVVNVSAAFSDYHVSGANPAGNASLTDAAFVANRFRVIETRTPWSS